MLIGLVGGTGSGKSTVAKYLAKKGAMIIDADAITQDLYLPGEPCYVKIISQFGSDALQSDGEINRVFLAQKVFSNKRQRKILESITHPHIMHSIKNSIKSFQESGVKIIVLDAPLLIEGGLNKLCDEVWFIKSSVTQRTKRLQKRSNWTKQQIEARMNAQLSDEDYASKSNCIIKNDLDIENMHAQIDTFLSKMSKMEEL